MKRLAALGSVLLLIAACGSAEDGPPPRPLPVLQHVSSSVATEIAAADAFGLDLLTAPALAKKTNLVVSPMSVFLTLRMIGAGAAGETAAQIEKVLHVTAGSRPRLPAFDQTDLKMSNTAWAQKGLRLKPDYRDTLSTRFGTTLHQTDFHADPDGARGQINQTVADQTAGKITDLFPSDAIDKDTRLVLTNALYLKADWAQEFPEDRTTDEKFTRGDGSTVTVPMMHNDPESEVDLGYAEGPGYQAVTLSYKGGRLAFTVIVPAAMDALRGKGLATLLSEVQPGPVVFGMPRFTAGSSLDLTKILMAAGMPEAFSETTADFSGITDDTALHLDSVQHKTFVQVDEKGTEAAAATGADTGVTSAPEVHTVIVDRPFLFVITDTATGAPLFLGRIADPTVE